MKSLNMFAKTLLIELGSWCSVSTERDLNTIASRVEHEGLSFLTITLPDFGRGLEKALDQGRIERNYFHPTWGFNNGVPKFLSGFLALVFDSHSGILLDQPSLTAIRAVRQFTLAFAKIGVECSEERTRRAKVGYLQCEKEVREADLRLTSEYSSDFSRMTLLLWGDVLADVDRKVFNGEILPKHGPGATADRLIGNQKFDLSEWTVRLEHEFNFLEFARASWSQYELDGVNFLEPGAERPVRVITVPKTLKTPRIIAIEPTCMQFMQQAIHEAIVESIRLFDNTRNFICYDSQIPNQDMARRGSLDGSLATLDLSEASDRVSNQHVRLLLRRFPSLFRGVDASRSRKADVDGNVVRLAKFASMGSALCFPMEAFVFTTIVFMGIQRSLGYQLSKDDIESFFGRVRVYGDDIIVPVEYARAVKDELETFGLKVNASKSFWTGKFRESCGGDYYDGTDVSIVRVRSLFPTSRQDSKELVSTVSLRNLLAKAGFDASVRFLDNLIEQIIPFPYVAETSPILGKWHVSGHYDVERMHPRYHTPLVKGVVVRSVLPANEINGYAALLKWYLKRGDLPFEDEDHLLKSGRPVCVDTKYGWARPY